jgi:hypothetical protein
MRGGSSSMKERPLQEEEKYLRERKTHQEKKTFQDGEMSQQVRKAHHERWKVSQDGKANQEDSSLYGGRSQSPASSCSSNYPNWRGICSYSKGFYPCLMLFLCLRWDACLTGARKRRGGIGPRMDVKWSGGSNNLELVS